MDPMLIAILVGVVGFVAVVRYLRWKTKAQRREALERFRDEGGELPGWHVTAYTFRRPEPEPITIEPREVDARELEAWLDGARAALPTFGPFEPLDSNAGFFGTTAEGGMTIRVSSPSVREARGTLLGREARLMVDLGHDSASLRVEPRPGTSAVEALELLVLPPLGPLQPGVVKPSTTPIGKLDYMTHAGIGGGPAARLLVDFATWHDGKVAEELLTTA
jgi:hypothetical protein